MSKSSRTDHFFIYVKDKDGNPTGNIIAVVLRSGMMFQGEAICSKEDKYDKKTGRELALKRALEAHEKWEASRHEELPKISKIKKIKVSYYESLFDKNKYEKEAQSFYKTKTRTTKTDYGSKLENIEIWASNFNDSSYWPDKVLKKSLITLNEDGNGVQINTNKQSFYLDYSEMVQLNLALNKFHELNKYGKFKRVK